MNDKISRQARLPRGAFQKSLGEAIAPYVKPGSDTADRLNWHAMQFDICPKCGEDFKKGLRVEKFAHSDDSMLIHSCKFMIRKSKYLAIKK